MRRHDFYPNIYTGIGSGVMSLGGAALGYFSEKHHLEAGFISNGALQVIAGALAVGGAVIALDHIGNR